MAKSKEFELQYKIEGLKRMIKHKVKRARKQRAKSLEKMSHRHWDEIHYNQDY